MDGLPPGSPEAKAADRAKDAERKAKARAAARLADPPALPAATNPSPALAPDLAPLPSDPALSDGAPVPWQSSALKPLTDQLIPAAEQVSVQIIATRAAKAKLPAGLMADIEKDCRWNPAAKTAIAVALPQVLAKYLNKSGISAENQPEVVLGTALVSIVIGQSMVLSRLNKVIAEQNKLAAAPAPAPAPETKESKS